MKLVVQIPALNEEKTVSDVIRSIPREFAGVDEIQVVVVDDGSTDRTGELAAQAGAVVVRHEQRRGVGAAFRSGIERSQALGADIVVTIDADGQFNPQDISRVIEPILKNEADFVTASRFADPALIPEMSAVKKWGNDFMARWISALIGRRFHDVSCGFRAYSRNAYLRLILLGDFTYTHETFLSLAFSRVPIAEVPIRVRGTREHGTSRVASNLLNYGWRTATIILKTYRDYRPLRFFGSIAAVLFTLAICFFAFLLSVKLRTGMLTPHKWAGFVSAALAGSALLVYLIGLVAEMLDRMRVAQDEVLFRVRRMENLLGLDRAGKKPK
jgi:glycosyltransferase involved in cell wall biosynthesis